MNIKRFFYSIFKKIYGRSFRQNVSILFVNKLTLIFFIIFVFLNIFIYVQYSETLKSFATLEKNFTLAEIIKQQKPPVDFLSDNFTCQTKQSISGCNNYFYITLIVFILLEIFVIYSYIANRKRIKKKILILFSVILQFLLIVPILSLGYAPYRAFDILGQEASKEVVKSINLLNHKEELRKSAIKDSLVEVSKKIETENELPTFIEDDPKEQAILQILGIKENKKDSLYKTLIIPYQTYYAKEISKEKDKIKFEVLLFPNNTLIVSPVNRNLLEELSPVLADKIVKLKFDKYVFNIKTSPIFDVPSEKEYSIIRRQEEEKFKNSLLAYIQKVEDNITQNSSALSENETNIIDINKEYDRYKVYGQGWLADCRSYWGAGHKNCIDGEQKINSELQSLVDAKKISEENIKNIKIYIGEGRNYLYLAQKNYEDFLKNPNIPENEDGVFFPLSNAIHLKYKPSNSYPFSQYLATAVHEYLHFYSYSYSYSYNTNSRYSDLPKFLDEGITEYLALLSVEDFLKKQVGISYPNQVEIVKRIEQIITGDELKNIYFSKNEDDLKKILDNTLSKGIYDILNEKGNLLFTISDKDKKTQENLKKQIYNLLFQRSEGSKTSN